MRVEPIRSEPIPLAPPVSMEVMVQKLLDVESISADHTDLQTWQLERRSDRLLELDNETHEITQEAIEKSQASSTWGALQDAGMAMQGAYHLASGVAAYAAAPVTGAALIASGTLSVTNIAFKYAGIWDWASKQLFDSEKNQGRFVFFVPLAIGGLCSMAAGQPSQEIDGSTLLGTAVAYVQMLGGVSNSNVEEVSSKVQALKSKGQIERNDLSSLIDDLRTLQETVFGTLERAADILNGDSRILQIINQPA